jgi:ribosomal protein L32
MKISHAKTASRRSHHQVTGAAVVKTATGARRKHFVDPVTGMYRGKQILNAPKAAVVVKKAAAKKKTVAKKAAPKKKAEKQD